MSANIDLLIDSNGTGLISGGSAPGNALPVLTRNDTYNFRLRVMNAPQGVAPADIDLSGSTLKLGIGTIDAEPTSGNFQLTLAGPVTSGNIPYNATTTQLFNAISGIAGAATVELYGTDGSSWLITAATNNTALSFAGVPFTLFPTSSVLVNTRRNPDTNSKAQQTVTLKRSPAVYTDSFSSASTAGVISLTKTQDGDSATNKNETYKLTVGPDAVGGSFVLAYGANAATAVAVGSDAATVQAAIASVTGIGSGNLIVAGLSNDQGYSLTFVNELGQQNVTTALTLDSSGVYYAPWKVATVTMGTAELDALFVEDDSATTITPTLEIELSTSGNPKTILQSPITIRRDLIVQGSSIPSPQASYYTKSESDNKFVEDLTTGAAGSINATNFKLEDSSSADSLDWQNRRLYDGSTERLRWTGGLSFYGASAIAKPTGSNLINSVSNLGLLSYSTPTQANVVSNLVTAGILSPSATYGVLPSSIHTLTTTASLDFGTFGAHDTIYQNVTVTGAATNDVVLIGLPNTVCLGLVYSGHVIAANTVCVGGHNTDNTTLNSVAQTFRITVIGY